MPDSMSGAVEPSSGDRVDWEGAVRDLASRAMQQTRPEPDWNGSDRPILLSRMRVAGVDPRYLEAEPDRLTPSAKPLLDKYVSGLAQNMENGVGLYLWGGVGTGKSSAAALIVREIAKDVSRAALWWSMGDLLTTLENPYERSQVLKRCQFASVLVLDDFGVQYLSPQYQQWVDQIVDARYRRRKPMIVTTNVDPTGLAKRPEMARVLDRWRSTMVIVPFTGGSRR